MSAVLSSGPAGKTRRTKVTRHAYYVPFDNGGDGGWRFLPIDRAHAQMIEGIDEEGNPTRAVDLYASKGYVAVEHIHDEKALAKLPSNWRDVANHGADPVFKDDKASDAKSA